MTNASRFFKNASSREATGQPGCLLFSVFFFAGCVAFAYLVGGIIWPEWQVNHSYIAHTCIVLDKRVGESDDTYRPEIHIRYTVQNKEFRIWTYDASGIYSSGHAGKQAIIDQFIVGGEHPCWYDPDNPSKAVLVRGYSFFLYLLFLVISLAFMGFGGGAMYFCRKQRGNAARERATAYPTVPTKDLSDSPGTTLKYRLPLALGPRWTFLIVLGLTLFWNGIAWLFAGFAGGSHLQGQPDWCLTVFILPFVAIGLFLIGASFRQFLITIGFSTAQVEIDAFPLTVGQATPIRVSQPGPLRLKSLSVLLLCEESASYEQGDGKETKTKRVYQGILAQASNVEVSRDIPWEFRGTVEVPRGAMHSFKATHNKIEWKLFVRGTVEWWPNFEWEYPLIVRPAIAGGET